MSAQSPALATKNTHEETMRCIQNFSYTVPWRISVSLVIIWRARTAVQSTDIRGQAMRLDDRRVTHNLQAMLKRTHVEAETENPTQLQEAEELKLAHLENSSDRAVYAAQLNVL
jgi:hypothetical protein